jgi:hypothetical protein
MQLLKLHQGRAKVGPAARAPAAGRRIDTAALHRKIEARLAEINRRMGGEG